MKGRGWVLLLFLVVWASHSPSSAVVDSPPLSFLPENHTIPDVPFYLKKEIRQGQATLASVISYWAREVNLDDFHGVGTLSENHGIPSLDLNPSGRVQGLDVWTYRGSLADLRNHITLNHPVIAFLGAPSDEFPVGHFIVVTGYDDRDRNVFAHSYSEPNQVVAYDRFVEEWAKADFWTLLILPKESTKIP